MILSGQKSDSAVYPKHRIANEPYLTVNFILAGVIFLIFIYSGIFSPERNNYPVACIHEKLTGQPCASCGLSHSFSLIVRGKISEARIWNANGLRIFIFFAGQFLMRIFFSFFYLKNDDISRELIVYDSAVSFMLFIVCFLPLIKSIFLFL
ncbi:MAG: DUF2752 domain-containing protein [Bacteroidales bacterium]|jgi:hypothetical protein|nr:DUF2752 domain-containing protein [Bacteroidales bacterium]HOW10676.1 DUF2752 domain-containing protein [Bacteroidales bacterium]